MYVRSDFGSSRPFVAYGGLGGIDEAKSTCPTPGVTRRASSELKACLASTGIRKSGAAFSPCTCCFSLWGHFGITLHLVYLTRAMALMVTLTKVNGTSHGYWPRHLFS